MKTMRSHLGLVAFSAVAALALAQGQATPVTEILGTWRGTSTCVDRVNYPACNDETVIYDVDTLSAPRGTVNLHADKVVNGVRDSMGTIQFKYDPAAKSWFSEFTTPRYHSLWTFTIEGDIMSGWLLDLPSRRQVRRVSVQRSITR